MDDHAFWELIAQSRRAFRADQIDGNMNLQADALRALLAQKDLAEIEAFDHLLQTHLLQAFTWKLWGAAELLQDGLCSDDGFMDFGSWLISMGRSIYQAAVTDPDSIASLVDDPSIEVFSFEEFQYIASNIYETLSGKPMPPHDSFAISEFPSGPRLWQNHADLERLYPCIASALRGKTLKR